MQSSVNTDNLIDIRDVVVDKDLPKRERVAEFVRQIRNPYRFRCGNFTVTARFSEDGPTLEMGVGKEQNTPVIHHSWLRRLPPTKRE